jgi:2-oxo-4-hydroxy-4-carboxy-5-ureidoimidazoline decarboxylase
MDAWQRLDRADEAGAAVWLVTCCGSTRWCDRMVARRPFRDQEALLQIAREEWFGLSPRDWKEAFAHHPKLGDRQALRARFPATGALSEQEQAGIAGASDAEIDALAAGNRQYEAKFGYIFIACATGQSASSLLSMLRTRLEHDPERELLIAAEEQAKITALRLGRGVGE